MYGLQHGGSSLVNVFTWRAGKVTGPGTVQFNPSCRRQTTLRSARGRPRSLPGVILHAPERCPAWLPDPRHCPAYVHQVRPLDPPHGPGTPA